MKHRLTLSIIAAAISLAGCSNAGADLAVQWRVFGLCQLNNEKPCSVELPTGSKFEPASVAAKDDAIRITSTVQSKAECEGFAERVFPLPGAMAQVIVNNIVVQPYFSLPVPDSIKSACATTPYNVSMIVARAQ
jgi:hypothetical protein